MFIDEARIFVEGGHGGDGCASFRREKYRPRGGPDGGNGGDGGRVMLGASPGRRTLIELHRKRHYKAKRGVKGGSGNKTGGRGDDMTVAVPPGTVVRDEDGHVLADLVAPGQSYIAARGGRGGRGNASLAGEAGGLPRFAEKGEPGESRSLNLELKLVADVAIVGFPNAGKSSLISKISAARPKIADYPFTTTEPHLGVVRGEESDYVVTDVPGLVPGAHLGKGMGVGFLRHIERASIIVYLIDMAPDTGREPAEDLVTLEEELGLYQPRLLERERLVVANKMDLAPPPAHLEALARESREKGLELIEISAITGDGLKNLLNSLAGKVSDRGSEGPDAGIEVTYSPRLERDAMRVSRRGDRFLVEGRDVERMVLMTDWNNEEARAHLSLKIRRAGVEDLLAEAGASEGDEAEIAGKVFEYIPDESAWRKEEERPSRESGGKGER